jgi:hypothetical protein
MSVLPACCLAQLRVATDLPTDRPRSVIVPVFTERESDVGSVYLTKKWSRGYVVLWNKKKIPEQNEYLLFNFDKMKNLIFSMDQYGKQLSYPVDSVLSFEIVENSVIYTFEKIPWISDGYYLMPIIQSEKGYSLYKRLFSKYLRSSYTNTGYYSEGKKYDEYADYYEYYLVYPGNTAYKKLTLKEKTIRRALKNEEALLNEYFSLNELDINEQSLLGVVQYIDDKKYPE